MKRGLQGTTLTISMSAPALNNGLKTRKQPGLIKVARALPRIGTQLMKAAISSTAWQKTAISKPCSLL